MNGTLEMYNRVSEGSLPNEVIVGFILGFVATSLYNWIKRRKP